MTATIWRTCPSCGSSFEQPDDPGRKRVYCSRACQQAAYRAANDSAPVSATAAGRRPRAARAGAPPTHLALLSATAVDLLDDVPDLTCKDNTRQGYVDDRGPTHNRRVEDPLTRLVSCSSPSFRAMCVEVGVSRGNGV